MADGDVGLFINDPLGTAGAAFNAADSRIFGDRQIEAPLWALIELVASAEEERDGRTPDFMDSR